MSPNFLTIYQSRFSYQFKKAVLLQFIFIFLFVLYSYSNYPKRNEFHNESMLIILLYFILSCRTSFGCLIIPPCASSELQQQNIYLQWFSNWDDMAQRYDKQSKMHGDILVYLLSRYFLQ